MISIPTPERVFHAPDVLSLVKRRFGDSVLPLLLLTMSEARAIAEPLGGTTSPRFPTLQTSLTKGGYRFRKEDEDVRARVTELFISAAEAPLEVLNMAFGQLDRTTHQVVKYDPLECVKLLRKHTEFTRIGQLGTLSLHDLIALLREYSSLDPDQQHVDLVRFQTRFRSWDFRLTKRTPALVRST